MMVLTKRGGGTLVLTHRLQASKVHETEQGFTKLTVDGEEVLVTEGVGDVINWINELPYLMGAPAPAPEPSLIEGGALVRGEFKIFMETWTEKTNVDGVAGLEVHVVTSPELGVNLSLRAGQGVVVYDQTDNPPGGVRFPMDEPAGTVHGRKCPDVFMEAMAPKLPEAVALFKAAVRYRKANTPEMITGLINATKALADI